MSTETELKLSLAPEHIEKFLQHPLLQQASTTKHLRNVYFDTQELDLLRQKIGLRIRYVDDQRVQTVKTAGQSVGGLHQRQEWEVVITSDTPERDKIPEKIRDKMPLSPLVPVFTTDFQRIQWDIQQGDSTVELVLDQGCIKTTQTSLPLHEIELELKKGSTLALYEIALDLHNYVPLRIENQSKAARGYELFCPQVRKIVHAEAVQLNPSMTTKQAFIHIVWQGLKHLQANELAILQDNNAEAIHQMRVAVRRLRAYFKIFKPFVPVSYEGYATLRKELRWLGEETGVVRDWDVFYQSLEEVRKQTVETVETDVLDTLVVTVQYFQTQSYQKIQAILQSPRYHHLLLALGKWLTQQSELEYPEAHWDMPIKQLAHQMLQRRWRFVREQGENLLELSEEQRHAVRIEIKKLSYAARCVMSLYPAEVTQDYLDTLTELQSELGILNDMAVAHTLLDRAGLHPHSPARHLLIGWYAYQRVTHLKKLEKTWATWLKQKTFW
jgi:inorganic triphosphatase YgiF